MESDSLLEPKEGKKKDPNIKQMTVIPLAEKPFQMEYMEPTFL